MVSWATNYRLRRGPGQLSPGFPFAEYSHYDCRVKPEKFDKSSTARILYLTFDQYHGRLRGSRAGYVQRTGRV